MGDLRQPLNVFVRLELGYASFSQRSLTKVTQGLTISPKTFLKTISDYLTTSIGEAKEFEEKHKIETDPAIEKTLENRFKRYGSPDYHSRFFVAAKTFEGVKEYSSKLFVLELTKVSDRAEELEFLSRWTDAINKKSVYLNFRVRLPALHISAERGHLEIVKALLSAKADPNAVRTDIGTTALYSAAQNGHLEIVEALIVWGADLNIPDKDGWTPLMHLVFTNDAKVINLAISYGANIDFKNNNGHTALDIAKGQNKVIAQQVLEKRTRNIHRTDFHPPLPPQSARSSGSGKFLRASSEIISDGSNSNSASLPPLDGSLLLADVAVRKLLRNPASSKPAQISGLNEASEVPTTKAEEEVEFSKSKEYPYSKYPTTESLKPEDPNYYEVPSDGSYLSALSGEKPSSNAAIPNSKGAAQSMAQKLSGPQKSPKPSQGIT